MRALAVVLALLVCGALSACESTQDKSRKMGTQKVEQEQGVAVESQNRDVEVVSTKALQDENGAAVAITVRNTSKQAIAGMPVAIDVKGAKGASVFRNDQPGLEPSLVTISALAPRQSFTWVHDQVTPTGRVRNVKARIGEGKPAPDAVPKISFSGTKLEQDPVSGVALAGLASNRSSVEQRKLVVFAVGRKNGKVVAAGRGQIKRLKPNARARFTIFFIGSPKGSKIDLSAPPTAIG